MTCFYGSFFVQPFTGHHSPKPLSLSLSPFLSLPAPLFFPVSLPLFSFFSSPPIHFFLLNFLFPSFLLFSFFLYPLFSLSAFVVAFFLLHTSFPLHLHISLPYITTFFSPSSPHNLFFTSSFSCIPSIIPKPSLFPPLHVSLFLYKYLPPPFPTTPPYLSTLPLHPPHHGTAEVVDQTGRNTLGNTKVGGQRRQSYVDHIREAKNKE